MNLHEYQGKALFAKYGVPVLKGIPCTTVPEVKTAAEEIGGPIVVVKSQIHAGGRGKGTVYDTQTRDNVVLEGGVKLAKSADEAADIAEKILGNWLATKQTGDDAKQVQTIYVESGCAIAKELYCSVLLDRAVSKPMLVVSAEGGMDIEEVAEKTPEAIFNMHFEAAEGVHPHQARTLGFGIGLSPKEIPAFTKTLQALAKAFIEEDCDMVEVNPLVVTEDQQVIALDAKVSIDDNALFRHKDVAEMRDPNEEDPAELEAKEHGMAFVKLNGNIGCLVNGAGLAMATMDAIATYGAEEGAFPANFLDVGGGATAEQVTHAFKLILKDDSVEAILVNIFGGIMKCDVIAEGVLTAVREVGLDRPLVVRLEGTNVEQGKKLIAESDLQVIAADDLRDGCSKAAKAAVEWRNAKA